MAVGVRRMSTGVHRGPFPVWDEVRDLFVDVVEKFVEPCRSDHWPLNDVRLFLNQYLASVHSLGGFRHKALWDRDVDTLRGCFLCLYHD